MSLSLSPRVLADALRSSIGSLRSSGGPLARLVWRPRGHGAAVVVLSDGETTITRRIPVVAGTGLPMVCVDGRSLVALAQSLRDVPAIEVSAAEGEPRLKITCSRGEYWLATTGRVAPTMPRITDTEHMATVSAADLVAAAAAVSRAISATPTRYALHGARMESHGGALRLVATDGRWLVTRDIAGAEQSQPPREGEDATLLPVGAVRAIMSMSADAEDVARVAWTSSQITIETPSWSIGSVVLDGTFPGCSSILALAQHEAAIPVASPPVVSALRSIGAISGSSDEPPRARLVFRRGALDVTAEHSLGGATTTIEIDYAGEVRYVVMDVRLLARALASADAVMDWRVGEPDRPIMLQSSGVQIVIMPLSPTESERPPQSRAKKSGG